MGRGDDILPRIYGVSQWLYLGEIPLVQNRGEGQRYAMTGLVSWSLLTKSDLLQLLLAANPSERPSIDEVKGHMWFARYISVGSPTTPLMGLSGRASSLRNPRVIWPNI
jgi:hypothetical protein